MSEVLPRVNGSFNIKKSVILIQLKSNIPKDAQRSVAKLNKDPWFNFKKCKYNKYIVCTLLKTNGYAHNMKEYTC